MSSSPSSLVSRQSCASRLVHSMLLMAALLLSVCGWATVGVDADESNVSSRFMLVYSSTAGGNVLPYVDALTQCEKLGLRIPLIQSSEDNALLQSFIEKNTETKFPSSAVTFIALSRNTSCITGTCAWVLNSATSSTLVSTGNPSTGAQCAKDAYCNWAPMDPSATDFSCAGMLINGSWRSVACADDATLPSYVVCENSSVDITLPTAPFAKQYWYIIFIIVLLAVACVAVAVGLWWLLCGPMDACEDGEDAAHHDVESGLNSAMSAGRGNGLSSTARRSKTVSDEDADGQFMKVLPMDMSGSDADVQAPASNVGSRIRSSVKSSHVSESHY